jgi:hypothetical protein
LLAVEKEVQRFAPRFRHADELRLAARRVGLSGR